MARKSTSTAAVSEENKLQEKTKQRTTNPGVRVIHNKIYDSERGKTCHQCRQKTMSFAAGCKNQNNNKPCTMVFCHKCLLNRYGENAEEVEGLEEWSCPKCRGICNCSFCRKKQGQLPTGILCHVAKATGYSSVSDLLHAKSPENSALSKNVSDTGASPKNQSASKKEISSPRKKEKENLFDGRLDINLESPTSSVGVSRITRSKKSGMMQGESLENDSLSECYSCPDKEPKKTKQKTSKMLYAGQKDSAALRGCVSSTPLKNSPSKLRVPDVSKHYEVKPDEMVDVFEVGDSCMTKVSADVPADSYKSKKRNADIDSEKPDNKKVKKELKPEIVKGSMNWLQFQSQDLGADLPVGTELTTVGDVKLPLKDVGNALQFLEFCAAFGQTLDMKKGQSISILQELMNAESRKHRKLEHHSAVVRFHIQLLSLLQEESESRPKKLSTSNGKNSWLLALKKCLSESTHAIESLNIDCLDREAGGYYSLDSSTKLRVLIFLCDEVLETVRIRDWINDQESKFSKTAKPVKAKIIAEKDKDKSLKQKIMNELAQAIIAKDGASLSISEHDEIVRRIKSEAAQAHKEMRGSMSVGPKTKERAKAVRTEPMFLDVDGHAFWRLDGYSEESNILVQVVFGEKWTTFNDEQEKMVEKYISFREKMVRDQPVAEVPPSD
ncbi:uncharacterized protein LOC108216911 isoform X2 [Daucus carota subsp. sativus]|uniref:uncharacterized protein LOC108216911 isoform X2 n=1 Tax=Daucus carota subsp. sativus TaxID=79200 RepID=UPI0007F0372A|nr:PREDICTED: uncharacterized protein LOC108216911 isoform X2 [Daucus carota subsp. sativus]